MREKTHIGAIVGKRGTGKTTYGLELLNASAQPKKLIIDTFDHPSYRHIPILFLSEKNLRIWKKGTYRIVCNAEQMESCLSLLKEHLTNAFLLCEDAAKYLKSNLQPDVVSLFIDSKQKNIDVFLMFHEWGFVPPSVYRFCDSITVFKTKTSPVTRKNKIPPYQLVQDAWDRVVKDPSPYAREIVMTE